MRESLLIWKKKKREIKRIFLINKKKKPGIGERGEGTKEF